MIFREDRRNSTQRKSAGDGSIEHSGTDCSGLDGLQEAALAPLDRLKTPDLFKYPCP